MTLSVLTSGDDGLAVAVASCYPGVGAVVPALLPSVGVAVSQAIGDPVIAHGLLDYVGRGCEPDSAVEAVLSGSESRDLRQCAIVTANGVHASFTGGSVYPHAGTRSSPGGLACGNFLLSHDALLVASARLEDPGSPLGERTLRALADGNTAGGDARGLISAALLLSGTLSHLGYSLRIDRLDIRIDWSPRPIGDLQSATHQRLSYLLLSEFIRGERQLADAHEAAEVARKMSGTDPDASAALIVCHELISRRFGARTQGRELAEWLVDEHGGPGANGETIERLWSAL